MQLLRARLFEMELEKQRAEVAAKRKSQVSFPVSEILAAIWLVSSVKCILHCNDWHILNCPVAGRWALGRGLRR
jgi:hypothetical protein